MRFLKCVVPRVLTVSNICGSKTSKNVWSGKLYEYR